MKNQRGVSRTRDLSPLQWQLMMKCWKFNLRPGVNTRWARWAFRMGGLSLWAMKLRRTNGPNFKWAMMNFSGVFPEPWMQRWGKLHRPRPLKLKTRAELLRSMRPSYWKDLRADTGDVPDATATATQPRSRAPDAGERPTSSSTALDNTMNRP